MKPVAPGTVIFHRYRGYGVVTAVNLITGWISARFGSEARTLDLNLSSDEVQHADGEPIMFRRSPPDRMPHARLMAMVQPFHRLLQADRDQQAEDNGRDVDEEFLPAIGGMVGRV